MIQVLCSWTVLPDFHFIFLSLHILLPHQLLRTCSDPDLRQLFRTTLALNPFFEAEQQLMTSARSVDVAAAAANAEEDEEDVDIDDEESDEEEEDDENEELIRQLKELTAKNEEEEDEDEEDDEEEEEEEEVEEDDRNG